MDIEHQWDVVSDGVTDLGRSAFPESLASNNAFHRVERFAGARFESEEQVTSLWVFESQNDTRVISQRQDQTHLSRSVLSFLTGGYLSDVRTGQIDAILSPTRLQSRK